MSSSYRIKSSTEINKSYDLIYNTITEIRSRFQYPVYDPEDHLNKTIDPDDIITMFLFLSEAVLTEDSSCYYRFVVPFKNIMFTTNLGELGIHSEILDVVATQCPPKFEEKSSCSHPNKYKNVLSASLSFWVCPDCKKEV